MLNVPQNAVDCFEKLTGSTISCYIYSPVFSRLSRWRNHKSIYCGQQKEDFSTECIHFDSFHTVENIWNFPDGCIKTCHANFSEVVMPVIREGKLLCLLFAGMFYLAGDTGTIPVIKAVPKGNAKKYPGIKTLSTPEVTLLLEALKQLRARLLLWYDDMHKNELFWEQLSVKEQILLIFCRESPRDLTLKKLADLLHLSYNRTSHVVKEVTGKSFTQLLTHHRLEYACNLLALTRKSVAEIAAESGFGNAVNFYRIFKREYTLSPQEYREKMR